MANYELSHVSSRATDPVVTTALPPFGQMALCLCRHAGRCCRPCPIRAGCRLRWGTSGARVVPTSGFHGDKDMTVNPCNGDQVIAQARGASAAALQATVQQGHVSWRAVLRTHPARRCRGPDGPRAVGHLRCRPCLVEQHGRRLLHRSTRARCHAGDAPLLPPTSPSHSRAGSALNGREAKGRRITSPRPKRCRMRRPSDQRCWRTSSYRFSRSRSARTG